jgi:hypothetical protein
MSRPKISKELRRTNIVRVPMNNCEHNQVIELATARGWTVAAYVRWVALNLIMPDVPQLTHRPRVAAAKAPSPKKRSRR